LNKVYIVTGYYYRGMDTIRVAAAFWTHEECEKFIAEQTDAGSPMVKDDYIINICSIAPKCCRCARHPFDDGNKKEVSYIITVSGGTEAITINLGESINSMPSQN
jgi:hypothetical protein